MSRSLLITLSLAICGSACAAPALEVVEAVIPDWPQGAPAESKGSVTLSFVTSGGGVFAIETFTSDLPDEFVRESKAALDDWLVRVTVPGLCGPLQGRQTFAFDGRAEEKVAIGDLLVEPVDATRPIVSMDRVEVTASHTYRNFTPAEFRRAEKRNDDALRASAQRYEERWKRSGAEPRATYSTPGITPPKPTLRIQPKWPRSVLERGVEGWVWGRLSVRDDGVVTQADIVAWAPRAARAFEETTRSAFMRWRFEPARDASGAKVAAEVCQLIGYRLGGLG